MATFAPVRITAFSVLALVFFSSSAAADKDIPILDFESQVVGVGEDAAEFVVSLNIMGSGRDNYVVYGSSEREIFSIDGKKMVVMPPATEIARGRLDKSGMAAVSFLLPPGKSPRYVQGAVFKRDYFDSEATLSMVKAVMNLSGDKPTVPSEPSRLVIWSGGCSKPQTESGWSKYCTDTTEFSSAADHLYVDPAGVITVLKSGYYNIKMWSIASVVNYTVMRLTKNDSPFHESWVYSENEWQNNNVDIVWPFEAGDKLSAEFLGYNGTTYHSILPSPYSRMQVVYMSGL